MKKKIWILLPALVIVVVTAIVTWGLLSRPQTSSNLESADHYATSVEISSSPAPPPQLQEGQYLLVHEAETESVTVSKNMVYFSSSAFSYDSPHDQSSHETRSNRWIISISPQGAENSYRISIKQTETSTRFEDRHPVEIVPTDPVEFTFLLNSNNVLSWEDKKVMEQTKPISCQAYYLVQHVLSGAIYAHGDQTWSISPFFEFGNDTPGLTAQYIPAFQNNELVVDIQYTQQMDTQYVNNIIYSEGTPQIVNAKIDPFFYQLSVYSPEGLCLDQCQKSDIQAQASGSMSIYDDENPLISTTKLEYSREGYLIFPWNDPDSTYTQRMDFSSQTHHRIDVIKMEDGFSDLSSSRTR